MKTIREVCNDLLKWIQPDPLKKEFSLMVNDTELVAMLKWQQMDGQTADAESGDGKWTIKRVGSYLKPRVTVRIPGVSNDLLVFRPNWINGSGPVEFANGGQYQWDKWGKFKLLSSEWAFTDSKGQNNYINLVPVLQIANLTIETRIASAPMPDVELAILTLLGMYLLAPVDD